MNSSADQLRILFSRYFTEIKIDNIFDACMYRATRLIRPSAVVVFHTTVPAHEACTLGAWEVSRCNPQCNIRGFFKACLMFRSFGLFVVSSLLCGCWRATGSRDVRVTRALFC